jgi:hypothetical protein
MLQYIARISLSSKYGTSAVIIAGVMIDPQPLGVARRVKIHRESNPSRTHTMKRLSAEHVYSQTGFAWRSIRLAS